MKVIFQYKKALHCLVNHGISSSGNIYLYEKTNRLEDENDKTWGRRE